MHVNHGQNIKTKEKLKQFAFSPANMENNQVLCSCKKRKVFNIFEALPTA